MTTPPYPYPPQQQWPQALPVLPTSRLAVASLVVGIVAVVTMCFIPILPGAAAMALAIPALGRTGPQKLAGRGFAIAGLTLGAVALMISILSLAFWLPILNQGREAANRTSCAGNLQLLGQSLRQYAIDGDGSFPPDLDTLVANAGFDAQMLVCSSSQEEADPGSALTYGENLSYIYIGGGMSDDAPATAVLAYEELNNHDRDGANFLFADGSVRFIPQSEARGMIDQLKAGVNPPSPAPPAPSTLPTMPGNP
jgi:prepilin-type processing-associated H-X9-DG protein